MIVRLGGMDCRIQVWWQPSDGAWYSAIEIPTNTSVISGRRLVVGAGLLDRLPDVLPGNIVCRALDEDSGRVDPARDAWSEANAYARLRSVWVVAPLLCHCRRDAGVELGA